ncbi:synaptotagmin-4-like isoform X2 [Actinia tenebrosa]|uniref:Synaptotagmin-4-like isoform X2 n=1 Tax=Actinia tenebrosa TaxID=6105 RepID=A0A6P8I6V5_ACTTE|nr:synaptotagmin-4-like isoform X2 [Actinia tenebrosa]
MKVGWKLGVYLVVASAVCLVVLATTILAVRVYLSRKRKKTICNGIMSQLGISQTAPDFTIPLMLPMLIQDRLSSEGEETAGPVIRRLESVMDVSMFPEQPSFEKGQEVGGPWKSSRRESLFFPSLFGTRTRSAGTSTTSGGEMSLPSSPGKPERRSTQRKRTISDSSSTRNEPGSPIRPRVWSDMTATKKPQKPHLTKKVSLPEGAMSARPQLKKRFSEIHRRQKSSDSIIVGVGSKPSAKVLLATKRGNIVLTMRYSGEENQFIVHLINATDLPMKNNNLLDTFARLYLVMPSKQLRQQSKLHKKTCNPIYDESFTFEDIVYSELLQSYLRIKILHKDGFSRGEMIGESAIDLSEQEILTGKVLQRALLPKATSITEDGPGELLVSVCHHATKAQLKVVVIKLRDLPKSCKNSSISVELIYQDETLQRQQTRTKKPKKSPIFNEELNFHIPTNSSNTLENYSLQFTVFSQDILRGMVCVGYVTLGIDALRESEVHHWKAVVSSPHKPVTGLHKLHRTPV